jgi:hypothetical protein
MLLRLEGAVANASIRLDPGDAYVVPEWGDVIVMARLRAGIAFQ